MSQLYGIGRCHQLIVGRLIFDRKLILSLLKQDSGTHKGQMHKHVDFIKGNPVTHLIFKIPENRFAVIEVTINDLSVFPGAVFIHQIKRNIKVTDGYHRFYAIADKLVNQRFIKPQALLIWFCFLPGGKYTRPGKGKPIALKTHFRKQCNIFLKMSVQINCFSSRIGAVSGKIPVIHLPLHNRHPVFAVRNHIYKGHTAAALLPSAFALIGCRSSAPQKILPHS